MPPSETYSLMDNDLVLALTGIDYMFILVLGLVGNLRVSCRVSSGMSKETVVNWFMFNKAMANILLCLFVLPTFPVLLVMKTWPSCYFVCHLWPSVYYSLRYASVLTLQFISIFQGLCYCCRREMSDGQRIQRAKPIICLTIAWLVYFIISPLPIVGFFNLQEEIGYDNNGRYNLGQSGWPLDSIPENQMTPATFMLVVTLAVYVIGFVAISIKLWRMSTSKTTQLNAKHPITIAIRLMVIVAVACGICWMPIALSRVVPVNSNLGHNVIALGVIDVIAMSFMCFTPLCYMWLNGITIKQLLLPGQWFSDRSLQSDTALTTKDVQSSTTLNISSSYYKLNV